MLTKLFLLAQAAPAPVPTAAESEPSAFFNLRNLVLVVILIVVLIFYKVYRDKMMK